jgi:hypothetical protein
MNIKTCLDLGHRVLIYGVSTLTVLCGYGTWVLFQVRRYYRKNEAHGEEAMKAATKNLTRGKHDSTP